MPETLPQLLAAQAQRWADKPFLIFAEDDSTYSYAEMGAATAEVADILVNVLAVAPQQAVALLLPNIPAFAWWYWGTMCCGAIACPINTLLTGPEIGYIVDHVEARVLVTTQAFAEEVQRFATQCPQLRHIVVVSDPGGALPNTPLAAGVAAFEVPQTCYAEADLRAQAAPASRLAEALLVMANHVTPNTVAQIIYTSGTTGKPKGVMLSHGNLLANAHTLTQWFGWDETTRLMCVLPLFHVNGEVVTLNTPCWMGGSVVLNRKFSASSFWPNIARHQVQAFSCVPTILSILVQQGRPAEGVSPTLKLGICGAAPLPLEVHQQFETTFQVPIIEGYGLSETTCFSTFNPCHALEKRKWGSIGLAVGNDVAIWNEHLAPVPIGEAGEIVVRGDNVMQGYFKRPEETQNAFAGGWFHSGDWGTQDADGFFYILDRVKDLIIRGGENIAPREIDEVLYQHPDVSEAATVGVPDAKYGEAVVSFVVPQVGRNPTEAELLAFCSQRLAAFKCPSQVLFLEEIPKGPTGKLLRRELKRAYETQVCKN